MIALHQVQASNNSTLQPDSDMPIDWNETSGNKYRPFWIHESAVSETHDHVFNKFKHYVDGSKGHVSLVSILKNGEPWPP